MGVDVDTTGATNVPATIYPLKKIEVYKIIGQDLEMLKTFSFSKSGYSILASAFWATFLSFLSISIGVSINNEMTKMVIYIIMGVALILSIIFSIFTLKFYNDFSKKFTNMKEEVGN